MPKLTREEKLKLIEKLPQGLQDLLYSEDTGAFLLYLGEKYNLGDEKTSLLSKIVGDVVLGITPVTSLAQEINLKITSDTQMAMNLAQELHSDLLSPVVAPVKSQMPAIPTTPTTPPTIAQVPSSKLQAPSSDKYREPTIEPAPTLYPDGTVGVQVGAPTPVERGIGEIIDLRKTPPPPIQMPVAAAPAYIPPPKPLTFTKPVEPPIVSKVELPKPAPTPSLIEADPHKIPMPTPAPMPQPQKETSEERPQFIVRPPGLAPTDLPYDVLDLRKDKGEF